MPRPRTPKPVAEASGAAAKNPQRFRERSEPKVSALGDPPDFFNETECAAWLGFKKEMPWLAESDRAIVEIAARLRGRLISDPEMGVNALAQLRLCLSSMGGTPADRSKVSAPDEDDDDPADQFFN